MTYETVKNLGKEVCDVMQLLEAVAKAYNHRETDAKLQQIIAPTMKVCAAQLRTTLTELNLEELSHLYPAQNSANKNK
jgi:hypothetical protein